MATAVYPTSITFFEEGPGEPATHPAPWWYRLARWFFPEIEPGAPWSQTWRDRCREIPEPVEPSRIIMRQFALVQRYVYLQQFCGAEDSRYMHSHPFRWMFAIGLWGRYREVRICGPDRQRIAPYAYTMDASIVHHVQDVSPGHTSVFIGIGRDDNLKHYYGAPRTIDGGEVRVAWKGAVEKTPPTTARKLWSDHIKKMVARI